MKKHITLEILYKFFTGVLSTKDKDAMMTHFSDCEPCRKQFADATHLFTDKSLDSFDQMEDLEVERTMNKLQNRLKPINTKEKFTQTLENVIEWISVQSIDLVPQHLQFEFERVRCRTVRNSNEEIPMKYIHLVIYFSDLKANLFIEKDDNQKFCFAIKVTTKDKHLPKNIRLTLKRKGGGPISKLLKDGCLDIEELPFGSYNLMLSHKKIKKGQYYFNINETGKS
jgi:hypothetical protein